MMTPIFGGKNNKAYKLNLNGKNYFLKEYNQYADNKHCRLKSEYDFLTYAKACQSSHVTRPITYDEGKAIGIYEFIEGERYQQHVISKRDIEEALAFIEDINQYAFRTAAQHLSSAAEACFSIQEHIHCVDLRIKRLANIHLTDDLNKAAYLFAEQELKPKWTEVKQIILENMKQSNRSLTASLPLEERIISPSDFGFHNALKLADGRIMFVDFEYAGWDDPAKLIGDFFNQVEIPISLDYFDSFTKTIAALISATEEMIYRSRLLLPLYRIKWCCIILNYFVPLSKLQKEFVAVIKDEDRLLQLNKAKNHLSSLGLLYA